MNREIKFRAWSYKWDKMIFHNEDDYTIDVCNNTLWHDFSDDDNPVLLQYTGIKDKNGKEIYEGDIVDSWAGLKDNNETYFREVVYTDCRLEFKPLTGYALCKPNSHLFEIIGNIFENPELLQP